MNGLRLFEIYIYIYIESFEGNEYFLVTCIIPANVF